MLRNKIVALIANEVLYPRKPYWTSSVYGFGKWIRIYGYYPPILPLCVYTDHAPGETSNVHNAHEIESTAPVQFYHSLRRVTAWKAQFKKPCYPLYSPFVFARTQLGIKPAPERTGSIYFLAHTTAFLDDNKSPTKYAEEISQLSEIYKPITICLHHHDVEKGMAGIYKDLGFEVVTAGNPSDQNFPRNFYNILRTRKFSLSNIFGSYALYSIEMGIPFGLHGSAPSYFNRGDPNIEAGHYTSYSQSNYHQDAHRLFGLLPANSITSAQQEFATYHLGLENGVGRKEMAKVLYTSLLIWALKSPFLLASSIARKMRQRK